MFDITEELKKLPDQPGVYIMHDGRDAIIYIGKAVSLRKRVHQYFQPSHNEGIKKAQMVKQIARFEYIVTDSELEALVLECNLIKEHRPKYNTMLRDDKTYPYIRVTLGEDFPRVLFSRQQKKDKSRYFGPYTSGGAVKDTIELVNKIYQLRTCSRNLPKDTGKERPCLNYHIHQCTGPCQAYISREEYRKRVDAVIEFLNGSYAPVIKSLEEKMHAASAAMEFEKAIEYRELLNSVKQIAQKQKITHTDGEDKDIIAFAADDRDAVVQVFFIRDGKLIGRDHFYVRIGAEDTGSQIIGTFLKQFYSGTPFIPREIMLPQEVEEQEILADWLSERRGSKVYIRVPQKGMKEKLVELAQKNAELVLSQDREKIKREEGRTIGALKEIEKLLQIENLQRVEAFDISNTNGFETVGSMIVYEKGKPKRSDYRKFKIECAANGQDDYASMREMLTRRVQRYVDGDEKFSPLPNAFLIDGGLGHVRVCKEVLDSFGLSTLCFGMVKDDRHRTRALVTPEGKEIGIQGNQAIFSLIGQIQEETHRFAIEFHRQQQNQRVRGSVLDQIPGVGEKRRAELLKAFKSIKNIKSATLAELEDAVPKNTARAVYDFFHQKGEEPSCE